MLGDINIAALRKARTEMEDSDGQLFLAYCDGDQTAFSELFHRHKSALFAFCMRMVGDKDRAGDAFQETFIRIIRYKHTYDPKKTFSYWLFAIARHACYQLLKKERRFTDLDDLTLEADTTHERTLDYLERESIAEALGALPPEMREAVLLYEYEGFSYKEIAEMTNVSLSLVKVRIHRARKALRVMLQPIFRRDREERS